jgi:hypothetical protein
VPYFFCKPLIQSSRVLAFSKRKALKEDLLNRAPAATMAEAGNVLIDSDEQTESEDVPWLFFKLSEVCG